MIHLWYLSGVFFSEAAAGAVAAVVVYIRRLSVARRVRFFFVALMDVLMSATDGFVPAVGSDCQPRAALITRLRNHTHTHMVRLPKPTVRPLAGLAE